MTNTYRHVLLVLAGMLVIPPAMGNFYQFASSAVCWNERDNVIRQWEAVIRLRNEAESQCRERWASGGGTSGLQRCRTDTVNPLTRKADELVQKRDEVAAICKQMGRDESERRAAEERERQRQIAEQRQRQEQMERQRSNHAQAQERARQYNESRAAAQKEYERAQKAREVARMNQRELNNEMANQLSTGIMGILGLNRTQEDYVDDLRSSKPSHSEPTLEMVHSVANDILRGTTLDPGIASIQQNAFREIKIHQNRMLEEMAKLDSEIDAITTGSTSRSSGKNYTFKATPDPATRGSASRNDPGYESLAKADNPFGGSSAPATPARSAGSSRASSEYNLPDSNPFATGDSNSSGSRTSSATDNSAAPQRYKETTTGKEYVIPDGHTLYRDPKTKKLSVVRISNLKAAKDDDSPDGKICSKTGVGRVTPICERKRAAVSTR